MRSISTRETEAMATRPVREIITRDRPLVGRTNDTVRTAAKKMAEHGCGSILVCDGGKLRGIFTERDLLVRVVAAGRDAAKTKLVEVMTPEPDTIESSQPVVEAVRRMDECGYRHLPVLEGNRLLGVITPRDVPLDIIARLQPELEQRHLLAERMW
jgi:CBS domain-containing protein